MTHEDVAGAFAEAMPQHKAGLTLSHNEHLCFYLTVAQWEDDAAPDWVSPAEREKAIESGECWNLHWYPDTPVGHCTLAASSLSALLAHAAALT